MEEKIIKEASAILDGIAQRMERAKKEDWTTTRFLAVGSRVKVISPDQILQYTRKNWLHPWLGSPSFVYRSWRPLWTILQGDWCNFLNLLGSAETYTPFPQREIKIVSTLQELSATECLGLIDVYHKGRRVSRVEWHLMLSCGEAKLSVTFPVALSEMIKICFEGSNLTLYS